MSEDDRRPPLPGWAVLLLAAIGVALAGLAAMGARGLPGTGTSRRIADDLGWDPLTVLSWLVLAAFGFVAYMILTSPRGRIEAKGGGKRRTSSIAVFVVLTVLAALVLFAGRPGDNAGSDREVGLPGQGSLAEAAPAQPAGSVLSLLLFAGVIIATGVVLQSVARRRAAATHEDEIEGVFASVDAAIRELEMGGEPRKVVIAAYRNMESALARAGVPRGRHEAPLEYVSRSLSTLQVDDRAIGRLAALFEEARFSTHSIDDHMAGAAIRALSDIRSELGLI